MRGPATMFAVALLLMACPGSSDDDTTTAVADGTGSPSTGPDQPATGTVDSTGSGAPATSESGGATTTEADTGTTGDEMCTDETCTSLLTMTFSHDLALLDGPHPLDIQTPLHDLICSIDPAPEGQKSCFGFMFTDLSWDEQTITVEMTGPFFDTDLNPEATPFESVAVQLRLEDQTLYDEVLPVVSGDPIQPDPCGQVCWHATVDATIE